MKKGDLVITCPGEEWAAATGRVLTVSGTKLPYYEMDV